MPRVTVLWKPGPKAPEQLYRIDRLSLTGDSAGGNLAINAAYMAADGTLASSCGGRLPTAAPLVAEIATSRVIQV